MENTKKNNILSFLLLIISEMICFFIQKEHLLSCLKDNTYNFGINIAQFLYFLPFLIASLFTFFGQNFKSTLIHTTFGLIIYTIILHFFIKRIVSLFTTVSGTINFVEYISKIYFICLPLISIKILIIKMEQNRIKIDFWVAIRITLFVGMMLIGKKLFHLNGVLYSYPICEFILFLGASITFLKTKNNLLKSKIIS